MYASVYLSIGPISVQPIIVTATHIFLLQNLMIVNKYSTFCLI